MLVRDKAWQWTENEQFAYAYLKHKLLSGTACSYPDFRKQFILKSDACGSTVGAILSQKEDEGQEKMVACASQKLNGTEPAWSTYDKEFYALVWAVRQFSHYLRYRKFIVLTDH